MWFDGIRQPNTIYVASCSRGKDSTAMLRAIQLMGWPLDMIVAVDIWATDTIPAELPPMVKFKDKYDAKVLDWFGVPVTRLCAMKKVTSQPVNVERESRPREPHDEECHPQIYSYEDGLYQPITKQEQGYEHRIGANRGFPYRKGQWCTRDLKLPALRESNIREAFLSHSETPFKECSSRGRDSIRQISHQDWISREVPELVQLPAQSKCTRQTFLDMPQNEGQKINIVHYIGIAADEPIRIERHIQDPNKVLPLVQIGWDEDLCGLEATYMDMLSPTYEGSCRDGCWFCHNQGVPQLRSLRKNYPNLWELLLKWDNDSPVTFHADGHTVHDFDRRFQLEDDGLISPDDKIFRWSMLDAELNYRLF